MASIRTHNTRRRNANMSQRQHRQRRVEHRTRFYRKAMAGALRVMTATARNMRDAFIRFTPQIHRLGDSLRKTAELHTAFVDVDYGNVEAVVSQSLRQKFDIHRKLADELGVTRREAKEINYFTVYGMTPSRAAENEK